MKGWTACNSHLIVVAVHDILCMLEELQGLLAYPGMFVGSQLAACNTKCHKLPTCIRNPFMPTNTFCSDTLYVRTNPGSLPSFAGDCSFDIPLTECQAGTVADCPPARLHAYSSFHST